MIPAKERSGGWLGLRLLEHRVDIRGDDALVEWIARCFEPGAVETEAATGATQLTVHLSQGPRGGDGAECALGVTTDPSGALDALMRPGTRTPIDVTRAIVQWAVNHTQHYVFHAAALQRGDRGLLLPADSNRGKSTLAAALGQRGFALLSDEIGVVDPAKGRLVAFPRALSLRRDAFALLGRSESLGTSFDRGASRMVRAQGLGLRRAERGAEPSLIVFPSFEPGAAIQMRRLETGPAVLSLMQASCSQSRFKEAGLDLVIDLARRTPCHQLRFSNLREAVDRIETAFETRDSHSVSESSQHPTP
jgi:hypothetical protein